MQNISMNRAARTWVWIFVITLILLPILGITLYRITGDRAFQKQLDALRAQGCPVTLRELADAHALPLGVENAADTYLEAFDNLVKWSDEDALQDLPIAGKATLPPRTAALPAAMKERLTQYLTDNQVALDALHQAGRVPHCRYPIDLTQGFDVQLPWLSEIRQSAILLKLEAINSVDNGDPNQALQSVASSLALGQSIHPSTLIEQLVHIAVTALNIGTMEYLLNRTALSDAQLQDLADWLRREDPKGGLHTAILGERCMGIAFFRSPMRYSSMVSSTPQARFMVPLRALGYLQRDAAGYLDLMQAYLESLKLPTPEGLQITNNIQYQNYGGIFTKILSPALTRVIQLGCRAEAHQQIGLTAFAVERYRLAHHRLPDELGQLVPTYLAEVPLDPFDGQPLRYRLRNPGYVVYSINYDLTDDGGKEKSRGNNNGDVTFIVER